MSASLKKRIIIIYAIVMVIVAIGCYFYLNRTIYNPKGVSGNTTGNLNNNGMFCEYNGKLYFANPYDKDRLYVMDSDCNNIKKLNSDTVCSINVYGNYIYYVRDNFTEDMATMLFRGQLLGVIRTDLKGNKAKALYDSVAGVINLYGNTLYYQHYSNKDGFSFYSMKIDGKDNERLNNSGYYPSCIFGEKLYYVNQNTDHNIYTYDLNTKATSLFMEANAYQVDMAGDYLYYIDLDAGYSLVRVNTLTLEKQILYDGAMGKCISYNRYNNVIFYHVESDNPALYRVNTDGTNLDYVAYGNITNISCTSQYTFFQQFGSNILYRVPTTGPIQVEQITIEK